MIFRLEKPYSGSKGKESRLKSDIFNPKMLHNCPHALGDNSNPIDGHRWAIDAHRKKLRWPSMGLNGVSLRVRTQYAESSVFKIYSPIDKNIQTNG